MGGDGYTELVLYRDEENDSYWLHTYSKYENTPEEHASYKAEPDLAGKALAYIEEHKLASWKDNKGIPLCGADYILHFKSAGEMIRLDSGKMPDGLKAFTELKELLYSGVTEENRRFK